jgi:predicted DNA-binding mobile mystery protein A
MKTSDRRIRELARRQLDRRLERVRALVSDLRTPQGGWVGALRTAYAMSQADLACRMGISRQAVSQLEKRESDGSATLRALEQAAHALGGELVYAIVPKESIGEMLERRALRLAREMTGSVRHTMRLEDQAPDLDLDERERALARDLLASPGQLWSGPHDE